LIIAKDSGNAVVDMGEIRDKKTLNSGGEEKTPVPPIREDMNNLTLWKKSRLAGRVFSP